MDSITALLEKSLGDLRVSLQGCISANIMSILSTTYIFGFFCLFVLPISVTLQVLHKHVPCRTQEQSLFLTAVENTWIHGRQKRRERMRQLRELPRAPPCPGMGTHTSVIPHSQGVCVESKTTAAQELPEHQQPTEAPGNRSSSQDPSVPATQTLRAEQKEVSEKAPEAEGDTETWASTEAAQEAETENARAPAASEPAKAAQSPGAVKHFLFKCLLNVIDEEGDVVVEMHWVEGQNKDLMNQLCTHLKNTLLKSVAKS